MNTPTTIDATLPGTAADDADAAPEADGSVIEALSWRLMESTIAVAEMCTVYLGERLGLYRALDRLGSADVGTLASEAGVALRYAHEWCEQQAVAGFVAVDDVTASPGDRRYSLPSGHEAVLAQPESPAYLAPLGLMAAGISSGLPTLAAAFRTGEGVPYAAYGSSGREAQEALNRAGYLGGMGDWIGCLPDVRAALERPGARVADIGCGCGWSSVALAASFPGAAVVGVDVDQPSIERARQVALTQGVGDRVEFVRADATSELREELSGEFDLVTVFEALHDTARPTEVLSAIRTLLKPGGVVLVAEPAVEEQFTAPGSPTERMFMASSVLFCLPTAMSGADAEPTGAAMRPDLLRHLATDAGFAKVSAIPVEHPMWRFYRLDA